MPSMIDVVLELVNTALFLQGLVGSFVALLLTFSITMNKKEVEEFMLPMMILVHTWGIEVNFLVMTVAGIMFVMNIFGYSIVEEMMGRVQRG